MLQQPHDPYDLSHLTEDPKLKREFQSEAWKMLVRARIEFVGETQMQAAQFVMRKYHGTPSEQVNADDLSPPQPM